MAKAGMVWRCDRAGVVLEVVSSDVADIEVPVLGQLFYQNLTVEHQKTARQWWQESGSVKPLLSPVYFAGVRQSLPFTLGCSQVNGFYWLFWQQGSVTPAAPETTVPTAAVTNFTGWEPTPAQADLLEELSRVNNELVNARRELIKQNIELHRAHQKQKSSRQALSASSQPE